MRVLGAIIPSGGITPTTPPDVCDKLQSFSDEDFRGEGERIFFCVFESRYAVSHRYYVTWTYFISKYM